MQNREDFKKGLAALRAKAAVNYNHITVGEILSSFPGIELSEEQIALIHQYLEEEHIVLEDYQPHDTRTVTVKRTEESPDDFENSEGSGESPGIPAEIEGEEKEYFQMYLQDLESVEPCTEEEERILIGHLLAGDESAENRLIEGNLHRVLALAARRAGHGVLIGDLVQEGNMALITAIEEYAGAGVRISGAPFAEYLETRIGNAMKALIQEQGGYDKAAEDMARQANRLLEVTRELEEELGRTVTLSELAREMKLPEDEVENILRVSYSAMQSGDKSAESGQEEPSGQGSPYNPVEDFPYQP